jgi:glycogen phosphorylase
VPDYNVSTAECLIPAAELSQHISTAGTEASGTSNMKFQMNGCLIIGTMDGANVEIAEEIGADNMFVFGAAADQVARLRAERATFRPSADFQRAVELVRSGAFGWEDYFAPMLDAISGGSDYYLVANDFDAYVAAQDAVDAAYRDEAGWAEKSILSVAGSGKFSTDRTIAEYAKDIWDVKACKVPEEGE